MRKRIFISFTIITLLVSSSLIIRITSYKTPEEEIKKAGKLITEAKMRNSQKLAMEKFYEAAIYYDSAMVEWKNQNNRFILFRKYKKASELAAKSSKKCNEALIMTQNNKMKTEELLDLKIKELRERINYFDENFGTYPISDWHHDQATKSDLFYSEGVLAFEKKNYNVCKTKLDSVDIIINVLISYYEDILKKYLANYPIWKEMVDKSILYSHKHKVYLLIIDKLSRQLFVYKNGDITDSFNIELGYNWIGDKQQQGDKSTPEGVYKILEKKQKGNTKYHKAFLLNYPNDDDKKRFLINKNNGSIKSDANIGNLIEIHGNGGKGTDWTNGCIALKDKDMDRVFTICPVGTRVVIVGSIKPLHELSISLE